MLLPILALAAYIIVTNRGCTGVQLLGAGLVGFYWQQLAFLGHDAGHRTHVAQRGEMEGSRAFELPRRTMLRGGLCCCCSRSIGLGIGEKSCLLSHTGSA